MHSINSLCYDGSSSLPNIKPKRRTSRPTKKSAPAPPWRRWAAAREDRLAEHAGRLRIVDVCACGDDFCQSFYTGPKPAGAYGDGHRNVCLDAPWPGYLILDVVDDNIMYVEVLHRSPLR